MITRSFHSSIIFALVYAALLAGCSTTQGPANPPASADVSATARAPKESNHGNNPPYVDLLKEQIEGKLPHYFPRSVLKMEYTALREGGTLPRAHRDAAAVAIWAVDQPSANAPGYLIGATPKGRVVRVINLGNAFGGACVPTSVKVDSGQNVWVNCYQDGYPGSAVLEFNASGRLVTSYLFHAPNLCPPSQSGCFPFYAESYDAATNASFIFDSLSTATYEDCPPCYVIGGTGYDWLPRNTSSATPTFVNLLGCCSENIVQIGYIDVDSSGDLFFGYLSGNYNYPCNGFGYGVGEIKNPTAASWSFVDAIPSCSGPFSTGDVVGGVYVGYSGSISTLNVTDTTDHKIYRYVLPITASSTYTALGPTRSNKLGLGQPISGGFGPNDSRVVQGDVAGWIDSGTVATNKWIKISNVNLLGLHDGAALTPSDK